MRPTPSPNLPGRIHTCSLCWPSTSPATLSTWPKGTSCLAQPSHCHRATKSRQAGSSPHRWAPPFGHNCPCPVMVGHLRFSCRVGVNASAGAHGILFRARAGPWLAAGWDAGVMRSSREARVMPTSRESNAQRILGAWVGQGLLGLYAGSSFRQLLGRSVVSRAWRRGGICGWRA